LAFAGCAASIHTNAFAARGIDLTRYRTYSWVAAGDQSTGDPRLDNNRFFHERIRTDVEKHLAARGLENVTHGTAELLLQAHVRISQRIDPDRANRAFGYEGRPPEEYSDEPFVYDQGMIMLDFIDARTNRLVWRGWAETSMDQVIDNQTWMEEKIDRCVTRILSTFPRGV
jgi:hypothetical protein